jgi:hypothetical protein
MKTLMILSLFCAGVAGVFLSLMTQWQARDAYLALYGYTSEADRMIKQHANTVALPVLLLSLVCFVIVIVAVLHRNRRVD